MRLVTRSIDTLHVLAQRLGPYLVLEILLPGGTLFALLLYLYRRRASRAGSEALRAAVHVAQA